MTLCIPKLTTARRCKYGCTSSHPTLEVSARIDGISILGDLTYFNAVEPGQLGSDSVIVVHVVDMKRLWTCDSTHIAPIYHFLLFL